MARGTIVKRKSGSYAIVYRVYGKQKWKTIGPSKKMAERALTDTMSKIDRGEYRELKEITFGQFADKWLEDYVEIKCRPTTYSDYRTGINKHLKPYFGKNIPLTAISPDLVQGFVSMKVKEGRLSAKTIIGILVPFKEMLKHAVRWGYLRSNPAMYVERPRVEHKEMDFFTPREIGRFLDNVKAEHYTFFLLAVTTGMRIGEICGLKWTDINWLTNQIHVQRTFHSNKTFGAPKTRASVRRINMTPSLISTLKRHQLKSMPNEFELVFCNKSGNPVNRQNLVAREFKPALKRAGLKDIRFHDLRHTYASLLIHQGENIKYIQSQIGHASAQITWDTYGHLMPEVNNGAGERLDKSIFGEKTFVSKVLAEVDFNRIQDADNTSNALLDGGSGGRI